MKSKSNPNAKKVLFQRLGSRLYAFFEYKNELYWTRVTPKTLTYESTLVDFGKEKRKREHKRKVASAASKKKKKAA